MIPPTPLPIPSFDPDASDASAAHLLEFLQNLSDQFASDNAQTSEDYREACLHLIKSLNDHLLKRFPPPHEYIWSTLHERTKLTEVTLEFIPRATLHVGDIFHGKDSFAKSLVLRLLDVCHVLDTWLDVPDISDEEGYSTPSTLRRKAVDAIVAVLQCLGNSVKRDNENDGSNPAGWELLRSLISECIESCIDMQSTVHADEVLSIAFFTNPRIATYDAVKLDSDIHVIRVANPAELPLFMTSMLEIFLNAFCPRLLSQSLVADVFYRLVTVTQRTYQHLLSTACRTTAAKRARATVRLVNGLSRALQDCPDLAVIGENIRSHVLLSRIQDGPTAAWKGCDTSLAQSLSISLPSAVSVTNLKAVAATLTLDTWGEDTRDLHEACCIYVRTCLQRLDSDSLIEIRRTLAAAGQPNDVANLVAAITAQLDAQAALRSDANRSAEPANVHSWRVTLRTITQAIVEPDDLAWMDDDESTSDSHYVSRAISDIEARFERPLYNPSASSRIKLAAELLRLPCALARHSESGCVMEPTKSGVNALQPCLRVSMLLLDGPENEATPLVRKAVYDALARSINHQTSSYGGGKLEHVTQLASRGLKDVDRSVRLAAGRCLVQLVKLYQRLGRPTHTDAIFSALSQVLATSDTCLHEAAVITSGSIAKIAVSSILVKSLLPLLSALGQSNPVLKGVAYMQLSAIAKHRQTTHYSFLFPLMDRIAPFLITRMRKQPSALHEVARFLSVRLSDFLNVTLVHTLPQIFFNQDRPTLEAISAATQKKNHSLFLTHESKILARAFMASKPGQTRNILNFITSVLNEAAGNGQIDIDSLIGSSIVNLIAELVLYMGDEDSAVADQAVQALRKVEGIVSANEKQAASGDRDPISAFLEPHMLGVITHINDVLQNKHTVEMKRCAVRSLGRFVRQIGNVISNVAPQVLATLQSTLMVEELADVSLESWDIFLRHLDVQDIGSYIGPTSAAIVTFWDTFSIQAKKTARQCLEYIVSEIGEELAKGEKLGELADLAVIPEFKPLQSRVKKLRGPTNSTTKLQLLLNRITNDNQLVVARALEELKSYLIAEETLIRQLSSGDFFHPLIGRTMSALLMTTSRDGENADHLRLLAFECIGALGALDPDRLELGEGETKMVVINNFTDDAESQDFAVHLIKDVLVGAFRSTSDTQYQTSLAYTIQELMRFCNFTTSLVMPGSAGAVSLKARSRWSALPKYVIETITPFLASRYTLNAKPMPPVEYPIYPAFSTYREWISAWTSSLLDQVSGPQARTIFSVFAAVIRNRDVGVAHHLLPHLVLNVLISGKPDDVERIRGELLSVLEDQVDPSAKSTADKRDLSAQTVFSLMDHLNKWVRSIRQQLNARKPAGKRARNLQATSLEEQLVRVDSMVSSIDQNLMAKAALRCKAYARALMSFEQQVVMLRSTAGRNALSDHYERLHEMYAQLDEPDGMEGIATLILTPSLEHQIRQNESTGRWTAAQSCWEVQLQRTPDELRSHLGLLRCLKNIGHYDTLRTHVEGVLRRRPDWEPDLIGYQVESACMVGKWEEVQQIVNSTSAESSSVLNAKVLLAMRSGDEQSVSSALSEARKSLGAPIIAAGSRGYRRSYEAALDLHLLHELRVMHDHLNRSLNSSKKRPSLAYLDRLLATRLESIQPSFRFREPIISLRRTALALRTSDVDPMPYIGRSWLLSAKLARKAGYTQTAYSAVLQAQQLKTSFSFIESAKLTRLNGEPLRALQDLEHWLNVTDPSDVIDLTGEDAASGQQRFRAKALLLRAKWESESNRFDAKDILVMFQEASEYGGKWESGLYHYGQYQDESFKSLSPADKLERGSVMNLNTIKWFGESMLYGDKYIYQTVPRLLTLWLDMAEQQMNAPENKELSKATVFLSKHVHEAPAYKWYTAFPQLVSRIDHPHPAVWSVLQKLIIRIIQEYPRQALWGFASSTHSPSETVRKVRAHAILGKVKSQSSGPTQKWILATVAMTRELLAMCNLAVAEKQTSLSMSKNFPRLLKLAPSDLIIPLQESIIASLPPAGVSSRDHEPFPQDAPQFHKFFDEVEVMNSLAKPRKITIQGSDGQIYLFLAKPKDDLRKDARLMDLYSIINKLLKSNSESRRRRLRIRTYGVVTLNETCGLIQWVPNTIPIRTVVTRLYESHGLAYFNSALSELYKILPGKKEEEAVQIYNEKVFPMYKPVLHEWFVETFPEPSVWLASRLAYSRTNAVMCMVGFIIGLGDRHLENILLDLNSGDLVHVDFNCLFEKGRTLEIPERVPFRLTQNIVDGLGVTGVEGVFRIACELTLQLLRDNRDCLISILDAFIHDPLTDWYEERIKLVKRGNSVAASVDLKVLAKNALNPIGKKLRGIYAVGPEKGEREITTGRLVQLLIEEATDTGKLARMYVGWGPWV